MPIEEASRFGIMSADEDGTIFKFEEKPKNPTSTKASMGIYIFNKQTLFDYLTADNEDPDSDKDFGKNIIPKMLAAGEKMVAYPFTGYWKDVGTLSSLWEANMDLLGEHPVLDLTDGDKRVRSRTMARPPQYVGESAVIDNALITEGCEIEGTVTGSVLSGGVRVEKGAVVKDSVIMGDARIGEGARVEYAIIDENVVIGKDAKIGGESRDPKNIAVVGAFSVIGDNETVSPGEIVSSKTKKGGSAQ